MQLLILPHIPLDELARLATLSKGIREAYKERLKERETCIQEHLSGGWPTQVTDGFSKADMAVPRDLVVSPPVCVAPIGVWYFATSTLLPGIGSRRQPSLRTQS
jgi:hypothetical protein